MLPSERIEEIAKKIRATNSIYDGTSPNSIPSTVDYLSAIMEYLDEEYKEETEANERIRDISLKIIKNYPNRIV